MRLTKKGQVTIPAHIRERLGIKPGSEIEFMEQDGKVYLMKKQNQIKMKRFRKFRGIATVKLTSNEIMNLTRGKE